VLRRPGTICAAIALAAASALPASALTAMEMVERALRATEQVEDYTATVAVSIEAPNINIPRRTVKVYYKRPDKVHVESDGIAVIPRDALLMGNLAMHIKDFASASFIAEGTLRGRPVRCIKLAPLDPEASSGRVLLWIDSERYLLLKSEIWRAEKRQLSVRFHHELVSGHWMPSQINTDVAKGALGRDRDGPARFDMQFTNYRVNTGLSDSIFEGSD